MTRLILASGSPRRRELLAYFGVPFDVRAPDVDETPLTGEQPAAYVERVARSKVDAVDGDIVIAADTTVVLDGTIMGKPADPSEAARMLRALAGHDHEVLTAVAVKSGGTVTTTVVHTIVTMTPITDEDIEWYVATGEPLDKAGAYALQGTGGIFVARLDGSASNVVGLPLAELMALLRASGFDLTPALPGAP
jgi:septum formation protein